MPRKTKTYQPGSLDAPPPGFSAVLDLAAQMLADPSCDPDCSARRYYAQGVVENFCKAYLKDDMWRSTYITFGALEAIVEYGDLGKKGKKPKLQRCHGIGRLDRNARFKAMMEMHAAEAEVEKIWALYVAHDSTVLALSTEHKKGWNPGLDSLVSVPQPALGADRLFRPDGFSSRIKAEEIEWARGALTAGG